MINGVIFDADGVLLDSTAIWKDMGSRYLTERGITPDRELDRTLFSMSMEQGAEYLREHYIKNVSAAEIVRDIKKRLESFYFYEVRTKEGAHALAELLFARGIGAAVATSSPRSHVTAAFERLGLLKYFKGIYTTAEVGESKHSPKIYYDAAKLLNTDPENTAVLEDSLYALKTAEKSDFFTVGVHDENCPDDIADMRRHSRVYLEKLTDLGKYF